MSGLRQPASRFNCFSPPIMVATFIIEIALAVYTLWRYRFTAVTKLITVSLLALATFQLCEYHVCGGMGLRAEQWARLGFIAITLLPPLGLHILHQFAGRSNRWLTGSAYGTMVAFSGYFLLRPHVFEGYACTGNYVIFQLGLQPSNLYALYYYGWLGVALVLGFIWTRQKAKAAKGLTLHRSQAIKGLMVGYLVFLVPTALANSVNPASRQAIPSIMCGFAILFALILVLYCLPKLAHQRHALDETR